jgi:hypothetical protein
VQLIGILPTANVIQDAATGFITAGVLALVAAKLNIGRGWARWLFLFLYIIGSLISAVLVMLAPQVFIALPTLLQVSGIAQFALQTVALVLMFTRASRRWFRLSRTGVDSGAL